MDFKLTPAQHALSLGHHALRTPDLSYGEKCQVLSTVKRDIRLLTPDRHELAWAMAEFGKLEKMLTPPSFADDDQ